MVKYMLQECDNYLQIDENKRWLFNVRHTLHDNCSLHNWPLISIC